MKAKIFTDGGARGNPGPAGIGFVVFDEVSGRLVNKFGKKVGIATNNVAEYLAVIEALSYLKKIIVERADFFLDSQLVVNQLNGVFRVKNLNLKKLILKTKELEREIGVTVTYQLIPREKNQQADKMVNQAIDS